MSAGCGDSERVLSWYVDASGSAPVFMTITAYEVPEFHYFAIQACGLEGDRVCKPRVFGSRRLAKQRWLEATGCEVLADEVFEAVAR